VLAGVVLGAVVEAVSVFVERTGIVALVEVVFVFS
jgi:hypothetical protein